MRFCIVSPPTVTEFSSEIVQKDAILTLAEHAPLGVLTLAAVLEHKGVEVEYVDLNVAYYDFLRGEAASGERSDFCGFAAAQILERPFDAIGFGTICSSYPLTLRLVEAIKAKRPRTPTILGGPQASATDLATLAEFPPVDFILRYEAEESLPALLNAIDLGDPLDSVKGLTYRAGGEVRRTVSAPPIENLDSVPTPAFERYPYIRTARYIPLELGRGCPYACTFCSTNDFFRRDFRLKSSRHVVEEMSALKKEYGVAVFDLIHDMFTVNRKKVVEFCNAVLESGETFYWNCSARSDRVDAELLELMAEAGCRGIFFGIETGSQRLQRVLKKNLILSDAIQKVRCASELGMSTAASLITGFPDETPEDFADTADFFVRALRYENATPQLHILAPLADTPIEREYRPRLAFDDIVSDMSHQGWTQECADRDLISRHPSVFSSFYAVPTPLDRPWIKEARAFLLYGCRRFRWLLVALHQEAGHILDVLKAFRAWLQGNRPDVCAPGVDLTAYFQREGFVEDFPQFIRETYAGRVASGPALEAIADFSNAFHGVDGEGARSTDRCENKPEASAVLRRKAYGAKSVPVLADHVRLVQTEFDFSELMALLIEGEPLSQVRREARTLASRKLPNRRLEVIQLSPMSLALLQLCDGDRCTESILRLFSERYPRHDDIPADKAAIVGLELLRHDNLITERAPDETAVTLPASG